LDLFQLLNKNVFNETLKILKFNFLLILVGDV